MANYYSDIPELKFHLNNPMMERICQLKERDYRDKDEFDYAPSDYADAMDSYDKVLEITGGITADVIAANAESVDEEGPHCANGRVEYAQGTKQNLETMVKAGLNGMTMPRRFGGLNFPITPYTMCAEIVAAADAGFGNIWSLQDCIETLYEFGNEDQHSRFIPRICAGETMSMDLTEPDAGSDLQSVMLKATYDEENQCWRLNGVKRFITNGDANLHLVLARSEEGTKDGRGLSMFIYDKNDGGVDVRRIENKMGPHNELGEISQHIIQIYRRLRETKEALYIEREKLITHLQTSREGLGVFTKDKKEILVNNLFTQYGNLISDQNLQTTEEIFSICEFQKIADFINKSQKRPANATEEKRMSLNINKNGRIFIIECIIFQDRSFEISINDITQEEEQIRLKRQLTQNIAHELKTPVSSIQGYLETIVSNDSIPREKMQTFLERCYAQSNRLSRLLRDISVLTRMDEAANMIDMEKVDISLLVGNIVNEVALELEEKHITVVNSLQPKIQLKGNYSLLYSIFRNLMDNAIAYAGTNIYIHIGCFREDENFYYFSFADTGVGVAPEHLNRLFERFYRVDKGRSRKLGGTGLGLAIVKNAVLIHGGTISAKNRQGGGLEFVFTLAKEK